MEWGIHSLAIGWSGIFAGVMSWYANPFWLITVVLGFLRKLTAAAVVGVIASALAFTVPLYIGQQLPGDEGDVTKCSIVRILPGCYFWVASIVLLPLASLVMRPRGVR